MEDLRVPELLTDGPGRLVTTTVTRLAPEVLLSTLAGGETIEVTPGHRIFRVDDGDWVAASRLRPGEHLLGNDKPIEIESVESEPGARRFFNIEVDVDHTYLVSPSRIQVHNVCPIGAVNIDAGSAVAFVSEDRRLDMR